MTGIIAGVPSTWARVAIDSYFSTVKGDDSYGMKRSSYRFARRIAGRGVRRW